MAAQASSAGLGVLLFSSDADLRRRLSALLLTAGQPVLAEREADEFLLAGGDGAAPHLLVLDLDDGAMLDDERLFEARERLSGVPLVVISSAMPPERVRRLLRLRAGDWLHKPFTDGEFSHAVGQVEDMGATGRSASVTTFVPASGGAGATTLTLLAASYLSQKHGSGSTCIVDLDFHSANCGFYLDRTSTLDLDALVASPHRLDQELLDRLSVDKGSGPTVYSFHRPDLFFQPTGRDLVLRLLDLATVRYQHVVVDLPSLRTPWFAEVIRGSDQVAVVFEANVPSMTHAQRALRDLQSIAGRKSIHAVANKTAFKLFGNVIDPGAVRKMTDGVPVSFIARNDEVAQNAINRALFPHEIAKGAPLVTDAKKAFDSIFTAAKAAR